MPGVIPPKGGAGSSGPGTRGDAPVPVQVDALFTASALAQLQGEFARSLGYSEEGLAISRRPGTALARCGR